MKKLFLLKIQGKIGIKKLVQLKMLGAAGFVSFFQ